MKRLAIALLVIVAGLSYAYFLRTPLPREQSSGSIKSVTTTNLNKHSTRMYSEDFFAQAYSVGELYKKQPSKKVLGGIVPHHLLAAPLVAGFFEGISDQEVSDIVLLGPNHFYVGNSNVVISKMMWRTTFGDVEPNLIKLKQLERDKAAVLNEEVFENEHSIYSVIPFVKKTFPSAKIIPIVLNGSTAKNDCDLLVESLSRVTDEKTVVIASVDFSHYLTSDEADRFDKESIAALESFDQQRILSLDPTKNFDSPPSLYVLTKLMQIKGAKNAGLVKNTNSAKLTKQPELKATTSYVTMYFTEP